MKFKALLVGLGRIGCGYDADLPFKQDELQSSPRTLTHARALVCHPGFELVGGVDPDPVAQEYFSRLYRLPTYSSIAEWRSVSDAPDPELIVLAAPAQLQPSLVRSVLAAICPRLLLLEKPVATTFSDALEIEECLKGKQVVRVAVNYTRRYLAAVLTWQKRIQAGDLGSFLHGQITYGKGLLSNGSHFVNLAESWLGPLTFGRLIDPGSSCFNFDREACIELKASAHADATLTVRSIGSAGLRSGEVDLWFERGRLCWLNNGKSIAFWPSCPPMPGDNYSQLALEPNLMPTGMEHYQHEVVSSLQNNLVDTQSSPCCSLRAALQTLKILLPAIEQC